MTTILHDLNQHVQREAKYQLQQDKGVAERKHDVNLLGQLYLEEVHKQRIIITIQQVSDHYDAEGIARFFNRHLHDRTAVVKVRIQPRGPGLVGPSGKALVQLRSHALLDQLEQSSYTPDDDVPYGTRQISAEIGRYGYINYRKASVYGLNNGQKRLGGALYNELYNDVSSALFHKGSLVQVGNLLRNIEDGDENDDDDDGCDEEEEGTPVSMSVWWSAAGTIKLGVNVISATLDIHLPLDGNTYLVRAQLKHIAGIKSMTVHKDTASDNLVLAWSLRLPPAIYRHQRRFQAGTKQAGQDSYVPEGSQELCKQQLELVPKAEELLGIDPMVLASADEDDVNEDADGLCDESADSADPQQKVAAAAAAAPVGSLNILTDEDDDGHPDLGSGDVDGGAVDMDHVISDDDQPDADDDGSLDGGLCIDELLGSAAWEDLKGADAEAQAEQAERTADSCLQQLQVVPLDSADGMLHPSTHHQQQHQQQQAQPCICECLQQTTQDPDVIDQQGPASCNGIMDVRQEVDRGLDAAVDTATTSDSSSAVQDNSTNVITDNDQEGGGDECDSCDAPCSPSTSSSSGSSNDRTNDDVSDVSGSGPGSRHYNGPDSQSLVVKQDQHIGKQYCTVNLHANDKQEVMKCDAAPGSGEHDSVACQDQRQTTNDSVSSDTRAVAAAAAATATATPADGSDCEQPCEVGSRFLMLWLQPGVEDLGVLDDDNSDWCRAVDPTPNKAIGNCLSYRVMLEPSAADELLPMLASVGLVQRELDWRSAPALDVQYTHEVNKTNWQDWLLSVVAGLTDEVAYRVHACVSRGLFYPEKLVDNLLAELRSTPEHLLAPALEHLLKLRPPLKEPLLTLKKCVKLVESSAKSEAAVPDYCAKVACCDVSPTRITVRPPNVEMSNRPLQHYKHLISSERFLRVTLADETGARLFADTDRSLDVLHRWRQILKGGITIGNSKYECLAYSASQLRNTCAWFFQSGDDISAADIRGWLGDFTGIRNVAKYAARLGQSFSQGYQATDLNTVTIVEVEDVKTVGFYQGPGKDGSFTVSDGIGRISPVMARKFPRAMGLGNTLPTAFQIRCGGAKGMLAVWDTAQDHHGATVKILDLEIQVRPSMVKFYCPQMEEKLTVELISYARYMPGYLNLMLILQLSTLGVPERVFINLLNQMTRQLDLMPYQPDAAKQVLQWMGCVDNEMLCVLRDMLEQDIELEDPFLSGCLQVLRAHSLKEISKRGRILVPNSCNLFGTLDESGYLQPGQCFIQIQRPVPVNYAQPTNLSSSGRPLGPPEIIPPQFVVVTRSPGPHPGDVRVLQTVVAPEGHPLRARLNEIVFPKNGPRPHTVEMSGGDLDGDQYFCSWDPDLVPDMMYHPMDHTPASPVVLDRDVTPDDWTDWFIAYGLWDMLGQISNAHLAKSDRSYRRQPHNADHNLQIFWHDVDGRPRFPTRGCTAHRDCLALARAASVAVDFAKSGRPAKISRNLRPNMYPHYMEKSSKRSESYRSSTVAGKLYDHSTVSQGLGVSSGKHISKARVAVLGVPTYSKKPDPKLACYSYRCDKYMAQAQILRQEYESDLNRLMLRYGVSGEAELVTGLLIKPSKPDERKRYDLGDEVQRKVTALRQVFRSKFEKQVRSTVGPDMDATDAQYVAESAAVAAAWYLVTYSTGVSLTDMNQPGQRAAGGSSSSSNHDPVNKRFHSFPWVVWDAVLMARHHADNLASLFDYDTPAEGSSAGGFDLSILAALSGENQQPPPGQDSDTQAAKAAATATEPSTTDASTTANGGEQNHEQSAAMGAAAVQQTGVAVAGDVSSSITIPDAGFACSLDQDKAGPSAQQAVTMEVQATCAAHAESVDGGSRVMAGHSTDGSSDLTGTACPATPIKVSPPLHPPSASSAADAICSQGVSEAPHSQSCAVDVSDKGDVSDKVEHTGIKPAHSNEAALQKPPSTTAEAAAEVGTAVMTASSSSPSSAEHNHCPEKVPHVSTAQQTHQDPAGLSTTPQAGPTTLSAAALPEPDKQRIEYTMMVLDACLWAARDSWEDVEKFTLNGWVVQIRTGEQFHEKSKIYYRNVSTGQVCRSFQELFPAIGLPLLPTQDPKVKCYLSCLKAEKKAQQQEAQQQQDTYEAQPGNSRPSSRTQQYQERTQLHHNYQQQQRQQWHPHSNGCWQSQSSEWPPHHQPQHREQSTRYHQYGYSGQQETLYYGRWFQPWQQHNMRGRPVDHYQNGNSWQYNHRNYSVGDRRHPYSVYGYTPLAEHYFDTNGDGTRPYNEGVGFATGGHVSQHNLSTDTLSPGSSGGAGRIQNRRNRSVTRRSTTPSRRSSSRTGTGTPDFSRQHLQPPPPPPDGRGTRLSPSASTPCSAGAGLPVVGCALGDECDGYQHYRDAYKYDCHFGHCYPPNGRLYPSDGDRHIGAPGRGFSQSRSRSRDCSSHSRSHSINRHYRQYDYCGHAPRQSGDYHLSTQPLTRGPHGIMARESSEDSGRVDGERYSPRHQSEHHDVRSDDHGTSHAPCPAVMQTAPSAVSHKGMEAGAVQPPAQCATISSCAVQHLLNANCATMPKTSGFVTSSSLHASRDHARTDSAVVLDGDDDGPPGL